MKEPLWKMVLAWGCVGLFFAFPFAIMAMHIVYLQHPVGQPFITEFRYLGEYLKTVTAIVISLSGFNTVEMFSAIKKDNSS